MSRCPLEAARMLASSSFREATAFPYYSDGLAILTFVPEPDCPTASVDKYGRVYYNPELIEKATLEQRVGIVVHETLHLLLKHYSRAEKIGASGKAWNAAADMEIHSQRKLQKLLSPDNWIETGNHQVWHSGTLHTMGIKGVFPEAYGYKNGKLAEYYYKRLSEDESEPDSSMGSPLESDSPGSGVDNQPAPWEQGPPNGKNAPGLHEDEMESVVHKVADKVSKSSKARSEIPGGLLRRFEEILEPPKANWQQLLRQNLRDAVTWVRGNVRYTYSQFNLRQTAVPQKGLVLPGRKSPVVEVSVVVDTSGSMGDGRLNRCASELQGILSVGSRPVTIVAVDAQVGNIQKVRRLEEVDLGKGGGGTDMRVGIEAALEKGNPNIIVVLTDGYTPWPSKPIPGVKLLACIINGRPGSAEWIPTVHIDV